MIPEKCNTTTIQTAIGLYVVLQEPNTEHSVESLISESLQATPFCTLQLLHTAIDSVHHSCGGTSTIAKYLLGVFAAETFPA